MRYRQRGSEATVWELVCSSAAMATPSAVVFVLRGTDGKCIHVPEADFPKQFEPLPSVVSPAATEAIKETLTLMRQISTIRFVAFPVFLTAFGVLAQTHLKETWIDKTVVAAAGLGLATVAIIFEMIFSRNLICWWRVIEKHIVAAPWDALVAHRTSWTLWLARAALFLPYAAFAAYWVYQLSGYASLAVAVAAAAALIAVWVWWNPQIVQPRSAP